MDFLNLNSDSKIQFPLLKVEFPILENDILNFTSSSIPTSISQIDISTQQVKSPNDFSKKVLTSGGWMYEKSRVLF
jgi:hypothetical protein